MPAQTYDDLNEAVVDLTEGLVLRAKADGVIENGSVYVSPCDFHERGAVPFCGCRTEVDPMSWTGIAVP